jgi:osmotically-inducible protein OsmY/endonuclease YncB( thermonuclease family)
MKLSPCRLQNKTSQSVVRATLVTLSLAGMVTGCTWIPTMINQGVDAATTVAEHRSLYTTAKDYTIRSEIRSRLGDEGLLLDISTDVYNGRVMLTGLVNYTAERDRAEELARLVSGVRGIYNEIQITRNASVQAFLQASAEGLVVESKLKVKLLTAEGVRSINYRLRAMNGVVYVFGTAVSPEELDRVVNIAYATRDVRDVITHVMRQDIDDSQVATTRGTELLPTSEGLRGQVLSIQYGYTLTVMVGNKRENVRLIGSEVPHLIHSVRGKQARDLLGRLVGGKAIRLEIEPVRRDRSKRLLAYVYAGDTFVNLELIRQGQAAVSKGRPSLKYAEEYQKAQIEAQQAGRGMWEAKPLLSKLR